MLLFDVDLTLDVTVVAENFQWEKLFCSQDAELAIILDRDLQPPPLGYLEDMIHISGHTITLIRESFLAGGLVNQKEWGPFLDV